MKFIYKNRVACLYVYALIFCISLYLIQGYGVDPNNGDDVYFSNALTNQGVFDFINLRYQTWSGRTLPEVIMIFTISNAVIWRIIISCCITLLTYSLVQLVALKKGSYLFPLACFFLFMNMPISVQWESIRWAAGSYNYLLPTTFCFFGLSIIKLQYSGNSG